VLREYKASKAHRVLRESLARAIILRELGSKRLTM
jgi:hypothetical protein